MTHSSVYSAFCVAYFAKRFVKYDITVLSSTWNVKIEALQEKLKVKC
jgi:hypothetical protein